jgi:hypothetical protein
MANWKKIGWIAGIGTASAAGLFYLARGVFNQAYSLEQLKQLSDQLQTIPKVNIHKLDFSGLTLRIDVKLKNPTSNGFKMRYPFVKVAYKTKTIGSSQAVDRVLSIPPYGEINIEGIMLNFPILGMLSVIGGLFNSLQSGEAVKLNITTTSTVDPLWQVSSTGEWKALNDYGIKKLRAIPYDDKQDATLKKSSAA